MFLQKFKTAVVAILNYNFVMLDHPRSSFMHLKFPFQFRVDRVRTFRDIAISLPVVSHQPDFARGVVSRISFLVLSFIKIG